MTYKYPSTATGWALFTAADAAAAREILGAGKQEDFTVLDTGFKDFLIQLSTDPTEVLGSIQNIKMDQSRTVGHFLTEFWRAITRGTGANKTVDELISVVYDLVDDVGETYQNSQNAIDFGLEVVSAGSNLIKNPGFEQIWFQQLGAGIFSTELPRSGNKSLRMTANGITTVSYTLLSTDTTPRNLTVKGGDVLYGEVWIRGKSTNNQSSGGTNGIKMFFQPYNADNVALEPSSFGVIADTTLNADWHQLNGYVTMPPDARYLTIHLQLTPDVEFGEKYYFDDIVVREVTLASQANAAAGTAQTAADAANSNALDALIYTGEVVSAGSNIIKNPGFETGRFAQIGSSFSTEQAHSDSKSLKITGNGFSTVAYTLLSEGSTPRKVSVTEDDIFYAEMWVRGSPSNTQTSGSNAVQMVFQPHNTFGVNLTPIVLSANISPELNSGWVSISSLVSMPIGARSMSIKLQLTSGVNNHQAFYFDDIVVREVTLASTANAAAGTAQTAADAANSNAQDALSYAGEVVSAGSNLIKNPGFETGRFAQIGSSFSTEQAHSDSRSLKITGNGFSTVAYTLLSDGITPRMLSVTEGDIFYAEVWVRGSPSNTQTSGGSNAVQMVFQPHNGLGLPLAPTVISTDADTTLSSDWTKLSNYVVMPVGAKSLTVKLQLTSAANNNQVFFFDDVVVREVTLASTANTTASTANTTADAAKANLQTTVDGIVQSVDGGSSTGAAHLTVREKLQNAWSNLWDGLSGNNAATATGKRPIDVFLAGKTTRNQADLGVTNSGIADGKVETGITGIHQSITGDSSSGSVTTIKARFQSAWSNLWHGLNGDSSVSTSDKTPGHIFTVGKAARDQANLGVTNAGVADGKVETAVTGIHQSITGDSSSGSVTTIKGRLQEAWSNLWDGLSGNSTATATGKRPLDVFLAGKTARLQADLGVTNAGVADGKAVTAQADANIGIMKAKFGSNMVYSPDFEDTSVTRQAWSTLGVGNGSYSTEQKYTGTRSYKFTADSYAAAGNGLGMQWYLDNKTQLASVSPGTTYYMECWIYAHASNATPNSGHYAYLSMYLHDSKNILGDGYAHAEYKLVSAITKGQWNKFSGYVTVPSGYDQAVFYYWQQVTAINDTYYIDNVIVREVTEGFTAKTNAQTITDGVYQAVEGGSATNNAHTTVKDRLQAAWSRMWDGLNGSTSASATGKTPADIFTVGKAARQQADLGVTNAGAAQGSVDTAVTGIHQSITGDSSSGSPATIKTRFQEAWSNLWHGLNGDGSVTTSNKTPGNIFTVGLAARNKANDAFTNAGLAQGTASSASSLATAKAKAGANLTVNGDCEDTSISPIAYGTPASYGFSTEQRHSGTRSYKWVQAASSFNGIWYSFAAGDRQLRTRAGERYYVEAWIFPHASNGTTGNAYFGALCEDSVGGGYTYINAGNDLGGGWASIPRGQWTKVSGYVTVPTGYDRISFYLQAINDVPAGYAFYVDDLVVREVTEASTVIDNIYQAVEGGSGTGNAPGTVKDRLQAAWSRLWDGLNNSSTASSTGKLPSDLFTVGKTARVQADLGVTNAGIADGKAAKASGITSALSKRSSNICTDPGFENTNMAFYADGGITRSTEVKRTGSYSAKFVSNLNWKSVRLTVDGDGQVLPPASPNDTYYTEFWIRGASTNSNTNTGAVYFQIVGYDSAGNQVEAPVSIWAGSLTTYKNTWYKVSGYVTLTNANTTQMLPIIGMSNDVPNGDIFYVDDVIMREVTEGFTAKTNAQTITDGVYQAVEGGSATGNSHATVKDRLQAAWSRMWDGLNNSSTASSTGKLPGDLFTVGKAARTKAEDAFTNAGVADGKALIAQSVTQTFIQGGANLVANPGFENTNFYGSGNYSTEQARSGSRSLKFTANGTTEVSYHLFTDNDNNRTVKGEGGETYYVEFWLRGDSSVSSGQAGIYFNCRDANDALIGFVNTFTNVTTAHRNTWIKYSGYAVLPANTARFYAVASVRSDVPNGRVLYMDDVVIREATESQTLTDSIHQSIQGGSTTGNSRASVKSNLQTAWSNFWDGLNGSGSASSSGKLPGDVFTVSAALKTRAENAHGRLDTTNANLFGNSNGGTQIQAAAITPGSIDSGKLASAVNSDISSRLPAATFRTRTRSSQNLIPSPSFEDTSFSRYAYNIGFTTSNYSTSQKRSGSYSFGWTTQSPTVNQYRGLLACPNDADTYFEVTAGEKYYLEGYFYVPTAAGSSGNVEAGVAYYDTNNAWISGENPSGCLLSVSSTVKNDWNKVSGYTTVPAGATRMQVWFLTNTGVLPNVTFYLDDVILREVTESTGIKQHLYGKNTVDSSILTGVLPSGIDGTKITTGSMPQSRVTNLTNDITTSKNLAKSKLLNSANLVSNPSFELTNLYDAALLDTTVKRSGSRSLKMTADGIYYKTQDVFYDEAGIMAIPVAGGDYFYVEGYVLRGGSTPGSGQVYFQSNYFDAAGNEYYVASVGMTPVANLSTSTWTKISGYLSVPADATKYRIYLVMDYTLASGTIVYFDDVVVKEYTSTANLNNTIFGQKTLKSELLSSVLPPNIDGSKIQTGSLPQSRVTNLSNDLTSISGTANTAKSVARTISYAGSNLLKNPGFEDTNFLFSPWWGDTALLNDNAAYARSGSRSVKLIGRGTTNQFSGLNVSTDTNGLVVIPATAGDTFYMEFWVKASAAYTNLQYLTFRLVGVNASGGETGEYPPVSIRQDQISSTSWTKVSGYVRLSAATTAGFYVQLYVDDLTPTTSSFYVDDLIIREVAHSALIADKLYGLGVYAPQNAIIGAALPTGIDGSKIQTGSMAQDRVTNLPADLAAKLRSNNFTSYIQGGSNLATNPGLEDSSLFIGWQNVGNQLAFNYNSTYVRTGSASLKMTGISDTLYHEVVSNPAGTLYLKGNPGQTFYVECWVKGDANNPTTPTSYNTFAIGVWAYSSIDGYLDASVIYVAGTTIGKSGWVKISGNVTISSDSRINLVRPLVILTGNATSSYTYYVDDIVVKEVSEINSVNAQIANALTNTTDTINSGGYSQALTALTNTYSTIDAINQQIRQQSTDKVATVAKGSSTTLTFANYTDGAIEAKIPAFYASTSGAGTGSLKITSGIAGWDVGNSGDRDEKLIYGGAASGSGTTSYATLTDYQFIKGTMTQPPQQNGGYFYALGRCNAAGTEYVFARAYCDGFLSYKADFGYKLAAGTEQVLKTGIPLTWSLDMSFEVGTTNGVRTYRIWSGNKIVWDSTVSGTYQVSESSSAYGSSNRYWGCIAQVRNGGKTSGKLSGVSVADNQAPTYAGSTARMTKNSGSTYALATAGDTDFLPAVASFFNNSSGGYSSLDITSDATNGTFTVAKAGTYIITARIALTSGAVSNGANAGIDLKRKTGGTWSIVQRGPSVYNADSASTGMALFGQWIQYLAAGDSVSLSARRTGSSANLTLGGTNINETYFAITSASIEQ